jgi:hypothetical protein
MQQTFFQKFEGTYTTAGQWGGLTAPWHDFKSLLSISANGTVRYGDGLATNIVLNGDTITFNLSPDTNSNLLVSANIGFSVTGNSKSFYGFAVPRGDGGIEYKGSYFTSITPDNIQSAINAIPPADLARIQTDARNLKTDLDNFINECRTDSKFATNVKNNPIKYFSDAGLSVLVPYIKQTPVSSINQIRSSGTSKTSGSYNIKIEFPGNNPIDLGDDFVEGVIAASCDKCKLIVGGIIVGFIVMGVIFTAIAVPEIAVALAAAFATLTYLQITGILLAAAGLGLLAGAAIRLIATKICQESGSCPKP